MNHHRRGMDTATGKICLFFILSIVLGLHTGCPESEQKVRSSSAPPTLLPESTLLTGSFEDLELTTGQTIFVPAYTGIHLSAKATIDLSTTISIHNTDSQGSIIIHSVQYDGGNGKLIKDYVQTPVHLTPMATSTFFVESVKPQEGFGANFIRV